MGDCMIQKDNVAVKITCFLASIVVVFFLPLYSLILWISKLVNHEIKWKLDDRSGPVKRYLVRNWLGSNATAQQHRIFIYFLLPSFSAFFLFVTFPFLHGLFLSLTNWSGLNTGNEVFIGLQNYVAIFKDARFAYSLYRTVLYSVMNIFAINVVAFFLAMLVTQELRLKNIYRAGFFMPNLIGGLVLGYIWQFIFNRALVSASEFFNPSLLISGETALVGLIIVVTWQYAGYIMMIYVAAIQNIPQDLIEASKIDGANAWQRLKTITLPLVAQAFTVSMFLTLVTSFKQFDTVMSLTQGGPGAIMTNWIGSMYGLAEMPVVQSTNLIAINIYQEAFSKYQMGVGQAKAIVFFIFLLAISLLQVYYNKRREVEL